MQQSLPPIYFHFLHSTTLEERTRLKSFLARLFKKERRSLDTVNYIFCSDAYLLQLNVQHLQHNTLTDIITFELSSPGEPLLADIYISVDRVRENAKTFHTTFKSELHRVIFHGALHCCGYGDKKPAQQMEMRLKEDELLQTYFVPRETK